MHGRLLILAYLVYSSVVVTAKGLGGHTLGGAFGSIRHRAVRRAEEHSNPGTSAQPQKRQAEQTTYTPVLAANFPDPCVIAGPKNSYVAFATTENGVHVQMASSHGSNLNLPWKLHAGYDALPKVGAWVFEAEKTGDEGLAAHKVWAPDVTKLKDGRYAMLYSAVTREDAGLHCLGIAYADELQGPYEPLDTPWVCDLEKGGDIDASFFWESGHLYVTWKKDGNAIQYRDPETQDLSTPIMLQEVSPTTGLPSSKTGKARQILDMCAACDETHLVEAPQIITAPSGDHILFFSTGSYGDGTYMEKYAVSKNIIGDKIPSYKDRQTMQLKYIWNEADYPRGYMRFRKSHVFFQTTGWGVANANKKTKRQNQPRSFISRSSASAEHEFSRRAANVTLTPGFPEMGVKGTLTGPGGASVIKTPEGKYVMLFHGITSEPGAELHRAMFAVALEISDTNEVSIGEYYTPG